MKQLFSPQEFWQSARWRLSKQVSGNSHQELLLPSGPALCMRLALAALLIYSSLRSTGEERVMCVTQAMSLQASLGREMSGPITSHWTGRIQAWHCQVQSWGLAACFSSPQFFRDCTHAIASIFPAHPSVPRVSSMMTRCLLQ